MDSILATIGIAIPGSFLGAFLFNKILFAEDSGISLKLLVEYQGMTFLGGFVGGVLIFVLAHRCIFEKRGLLMKHLNVLAPYLVLAQSFGRLGCLCAGCCYGKPTSLILGVRFVKGTPAYNHYGSQKIFPIQLLECFCLLLILFTIYFISLQYKFIAYLFLYGSVRFLLEFLRGDNRGDFVVKYLSPSQCICLIMIFIALVSIIWLTNNQKGRRKLENG
ncbi:phosphatidylglycerol:prolipoprotein diacylglycerol transferase [Hespellia stercorisuis DSM 15480]|uniref:Phosphatidylglycerol:prolipoprotein diacylglycerol transferase n=2 Tax=Hespellia stercorisuis TaxID=180311 RepID=A0A1M6U2D8_9FIRM|nr:phosphatidylglycerol:prolipoprotein diacylglycerol transferase [Hespellia stercorisuis DSM 15480]